MKMDLSINILPIRETNFEFVLYCKDGFQDEFDFSLYKTTIEEQKVTISYTKRDGFIEKTFFASNHVDLTKWYLFHQLVDKWIVSNLVRNFDSEKSHISIMLR